MRCNLAFVVLLVFASVSPGCGSSAPANDDEPATTTGGDNTPSDTPPTGNNNPPPGPGSTTLLSVVPNNATPPVGVTWHVGFTENMTLAQMQAFYATMVSVNDTIWQISEGQVRIHEIKFFDSVAPGVSASQYAFAGTGIDVSNLDIVIWPPQQWDIPFGGAVSDQAGRNGRHAIMPANVSTFVATHEGGHFLFNLSWNVGPLLVDEYQDGSQDQACVMESENLPLRWCAGHNHVNQSSQPRSCWEQILADYPNFTHRGNDTVSTMPAAPIATYNDVP